MYAIRSYYVEAERTRPADSLGGNRAFVHLPGKQLAKFDATLGFPLVHAFGLLLLLDGADLIVRDLHGHLLFRFGLKQSKKPANDNFCQHIGRIEIFFRGSRAIFSRAGFSAALGKFVRDRNNFV